MSHRNATGGRCYHQTLAVLRLRSAPGCRRGVRLIVAGLNGGQSRRVELDLRTKTSSPPLPLAPPLLPRGCNGRDNVCRAAKSETKSSPLFCVNFLLFCTSHPGGRSSTVDGGSLRAANSPANHGRLS